MRDPSQAPDASPPSLFLDEPPEDGHAVLEGTELEHARAVRLRTGDRCYGLDGRGTRWPLVVREMGPRRLEVEVEGLAAREPRPGDAGAALPWIELAIAWPRKNRAEPMLGALVQLGAAAITPLVARRRGADIIPPRPPERWGKIAREALKQSRRRWLPELGAARSLEDFLAARQRAVLAMLDPDGGMSFDTWLRSLRPSPAPPEENLLEADGTGTAERPIVVLIGPEGGFDEEEREALLLAAATPVWLGPHVLRIETAATAAMAIAACSLGSPFTAPPH